MVEFLDLLVCIELYIQFYLFYSRLSLVRLNYLVCLSGVGKSTIFVLNISFMSFYIHTYTSPMGAMMMAGEDDSLVGLWFVGQKYYRADRLATCEEKMLPIFEQTQEWLDSYFAGCKPEYLPAIRLKGTSFQMDIWNILQSIPYGTTVTYKDIAGVMARKRGLHTMSAQAVGNAVGRNPISVIVPCHRVVGSDGNLTGYAGGLARKMRLLALEGVDTTQFHFSLSSETSELSKLSLSDSLK